MGCIVAKADVDDAQIQAFLKEYQASTTFANEEVEETARIIGEADIMAGSGG